MSKTYTAEMAIAHDNSGSMYCDYELRAPDATWVCKTCGFENPMSRCWKCGSLETYCFDEQTLWWRDNQTFEEYQYPVGYFACKVCRATWTEGAPDDADEINEKDYE